MADFYHEHERAERGTVDAALIGDYDYVKGGSSETHTQELSLKANGSAQYKEFHETSSEKYTRVGKGTWGVIEGQKVIVHLDELTKDTKVKSKVPIAGMKDEVKTDRNIAFDVKYNDLLKAQPSGPSAPKSRWRKK